MIGQTLLEALRRQLSTGAEIHLLSGNARIPTGLLSTVGCAWMAAGLGFKNAKCGNRGARRRAGGLRVFATAAAIVIFWPAAFFVGGDKQTAAELSQMKGQMVAVEQASIAKKCGIQFQGPRPPGT